MPGHHRRCRLTAKEFNAAANPIVGRKIPLETLRDPKMQPALGICKTFPRVSLSFRVALAKCLGSSGGFTFRNWFSKNRSYAIFSAPQMTSDAAAQGREKSAPENARIMIPRPDSVARRC